MANRFNKCSTVRVSMDKVTVSEYKNKHNGSFSYQNTAYYLRSGINQQI